MHLTPHERSNFLFNEQGLYRKLVATKRPFVLKMAVAYDETCDKQFITHAASGWIVQVSETEPEEAER
ncbi:unnamed protein product [Prunus armeniaca]